MFNDGFKSQKTDKGPSLPVFYCLCFLLLLLVVPPARGADSEIDQQLNYLKQLSLEELTTLEVTSVSKSPEKLVDAASAIFVITAEDLRRGGFRSIPEALRLVPGMQVAHMDANKWAISARGFNAWFANKLLVLIDGRSVYSPLYSGVWWDVQDTMIEDIDRIEVIRGPGATLWGANAVNGVINIITKKARDTQGMLFTAGGGNLEQGFGSLRYGNSIGEDADYRVYLKYFNRDSFEKANGSRADDDWENIRGGFRLDWEHSDDTMTLQGDIYTGNSGGTTSITGTIPHQVFADNADISGGNLLGRWTRTLSTNDELSLQIYYDRTVRKLEILSETRDTFDLEFQHRFSLEDQQKITWGAGYRVAHDHQGNNFETIVFDPDSRTDSLFSAFVQDRISLFQDQLAITLGSKFEHNDFSGFEIQPSARLRWSPLSGHTLWAAVSRAVRTPSRADHDLSVKLLSFRTGPTVNYVTIHGNNHFDSEEVIAYEIGYRLYAIEHLSLDFAAFYNVYHDLRVTHMGSPSSPIFSFPPPVEREFPMTMANQYHMDTHGIEISGDLELTEWWRLSGAYSWLHTHLFSDDEETGLEMAEGNSPSHQFTCRSFIDLPGHLEFDTTLFYVDNLSSTYMHIPSYTRLDLRLGWQPRPNLELSLKLENLLDNRHPEYGSSDGIVTTQVPRSFYGKITWQF